MRVLVCGGRSYADKLLLDRKLDELHAGRGIILIIEGGASGADFFANVWAKKNGVPVRTFKVTDAEWRDINVPGAVVRRRKDGTKYNAAAGIWRNTRMLQEGKPDLVVAFPGGDGTANMVEQARRAGVEVIEFSGSD